MAVTLAKFRTMALALPEMVEADHWGNPSFRVGKKIVATVQPKAHTAVLKLTDFESSELAAAKPKVFEAVKWGHQGWTRVHLKLVPAALLQALLLDAWKRLAPKRALTAYSARQS